MARPLRYGEPDWDSPPHSNPINLEIMQKPLSNKSYEELRFGRLVASGSVNSNASYDNSIGRQVVTGGFRDQDILTIIVSEGVNSATFKIHENILTSSSKFVEAAMRHQFIEKYSRVVRLPTEAPDIFERYAQWLYSGLLNISDHDLLLKMYKLGERLLDDRFQEACLKALRGSFLPFTVDQILYILNNMLDHDQLRKYCLSELGRGIISGKYNFNQAQLEVLSDHMAELMQAVMETVSTKSGFNPKPADAKAPDQASAAPASAQPQGIRPTYYTPNIGWHYTNPAVGSQTTTGSLFGWPQPSAAPRVPSATSSLFNPAPATSSGLFGNAQASANPSIQPSASGATSSLFNPAPTTSRGLFGGTQASANPSIQPSASAATAPTKSAFGWSTTPDSTSFPPSRTHGLPATFGPSSDSQPPHNMSLFGAKVTASNLDQSSSSGLFAKQPSKTSTLPDRSVPFGSSFASLGRSPFSNQDSHSSAKPTVWTSENGEGSTKVQPGKSAAAPIRHPTKTPLELWLGKDVPAKVSKMSTARQTSLEMPGDTKSPISAASFSNRPDSGVRPAHLSQVASFNVDKGKGKEKALDWDEKSSEDKDNSVIYTPASSTVSDQPKTLAAAEQIASNTATFDADYDSSQQPISISSEPLIDYQVQLALLEERNRQRRMEARKEAESGGSGEQVKAKGGQEQTAPPKVANISSSSNPYDWTSNAIYMSTKQRQAAAGFEKYAHIPQSGFAQMGGRHAGASHSAGSSFGDGSSFPQKPLVLDRSTGMHVPAPPKFGVPTPLSPPTVLSAAQRVAAQTTAASLGRPDQ